MRVAAPILGPVWTTEGRVLIGGLALAAWLAATGFDVRWRRHWRFYLAIGIFNSAIPFSLYAFAAAHLSASMMAILNATSPMFGLLLGAAFAGERVTARKIAGLFLGACGVALIARPGAGGGPLFGWAVGACLGASCAYGVTGVLIRRLGEGVPSRGIAVGAQLFSALLLLPLLPLLPPVSAPSLLVVANLAVLGVFASGIAFILYFRLMSDIGATRALTVTFLIPLFAFLWGLLFLHETLTWGVAGGALLILGGTLLVMRG
jgi:drug/metabolite transporter (DMT)-like permease